MIKAAFRIVRISVFLLLPVLITGCGSVSPLSISPVQGRGRTALVPDFNQSFYHVTRDGTYRFILKSSGPSAGGVEQIFIMQVFWKPVPGVTPILSTAINATFKYLVITPQGTGRYSGAGLVRLHNGPKAAVMHATLVDGDLRLTAASGYFNDALGTARVQGDFKADRSARQTIALTLAARRKYFLKAFDTRIAVH